jgi:hypothetical protein
MTPSQRLREQNARELRCLVRWCAFPVLALVELVLFLISLALALIGLPHRAQAIAAWVNANLPDRQWYRGH